MNPSLRGGEIQDGLFVDEHLEPSPYVTWNLTVDMSLRNIATLH